MLDRHYYHSIIPTVIVSNEEDFSYYSNSRFVDKGKHFLKKQAFLDESASEYKYVLSHLRHECMVTLLNFLSVDLNRITHNCIVLKKTCKQ